LHLRIGDRALAVRTGPGSSFLELFLGSLASRAGRRTAASLHLTAALGADPLGHRLPPANRI